MYVEGPSLHLAAEQLHPFIGQRIETVSGNSRIGIGRLAGRDAVPVSGVQPGLLGELEFGPLFFGQRVSGAHASTPSCDSTISR